MLASINDHPRGSGKRTVARQSVKLFLFLTHISVLMCMTLEDEFCLKNLPQDDNCVFYIYRMLFICFLLRVIYHAVYEKSLLKTLKYFFDVDSLLIFVSLIKRY